jgi:precorrin-3B synthase
MSAPLRRGACPGLAAPMQTGDGWLVRIVTSGTTIGFDALAALCAAARQHGNGIIEVSGRGNIQIRGLTPASAPAFAHAVAGLEISAGDGVSILADPLAGLDPRPSIDAGRLAAELRQRLATASFAARLGPKVSVVVDAGSVLHLDAVGADVRLRAENASGDIGLHIALGGDAATATPIGTVAEMDAVEAAMRLLETIAKRGAGARARELIHREGALSPFRTAVAGLVHAAPAPAARPRAEPIGTHAMRDGSVVLGIGLAFGHTDAAALEGLIQSAGRAGGRGIRMAPGRALLIVGLAPDIASSLAARAENLGFITRRDDPRRYVVACAGAPICAAAEIPARALGPLVSVAAGPLLDGSLTLHVSGCPKGCAHPAPAALTIVGGKSGCGLIANGSARDRPSATVTAAALPESLARIAAEIEHASRPGERAADTLARLDTAHIATILGEAGHG